MRIIGWLLGAVFVVIGIINTFWGNDPGYGIFVLLSSLLFLPPSSTWIGKKLGFNIPLWLKIALAVFLLWSALGVAELFGKIKIMLESFS